jgi:hypothetical protein
LDSKHDIEERLDRKVRSMVQQVLGEVKGKREAKTIGAGASTSKNNTVASTGIRGQARVINPNLQQLYYQAQAYGPGMQTFQDPYYPRPPIIPPPTGGAYLGMSENVREHVACTLREFGIEPKGRVRTYHKPYPDVFDTVPYPRGFHVPDFAKFTGDDSKNHV